MWNFENKLHREFWNVMFWTSTGTDSEYYVQC